MLYPWHLCVTVGLVSFTNPPAAGSGLVERTPKKVVPPPIWSFSSPSFVVQRNTKLPKNWEIHVTVSAPSRMTKSGEEGLLTIVTTFVSEIYFSMWFLESSCVDDSEYVPNLPAAMYIFFTTSVQSENLTFLGVRSTNPLPAASGLVKLTRWVQAPPPETSRQRLNSTPVPSKLPVPLVKEPPSFLQNRIRGSVL